MLLPDISGLYPPPRGVQLHPSPPQYLLLLPAWSLLLLLLASHLRLALGCLLLACLVLLDALGCLLVAAACMLAAAGCWLPALLDAGCLLLVVCSVLLLLAAVGAEESLFVRIESSCIPSES